MRNFKRILVALVLVVMMGSVVIASAETVVPFTVSNLGSAYFATACSAVAEGS